MKTEIRKEIINHPELGKLEKTFEYIYDETKYSSLDECIADHKKMEAELNAESESITKANNDAIYESKKLYNEEMQKFANKLDELRIQYESAIKDLNDKKPIYIQPELKKVDETKYSGRGYVNKTIYTKDATVDVVNILSSCSPEQLQQIKEILK